MISRLIDKVKELEIEKIEIEQENIELAKRYAKVEAKIEVYNELIEEMSIKAEPEDTEIEISETTGVYDFDTGM